MNPTTPDELRQLAADVSFSPVTNPLREDSMTPELAAAIKDTEAFKRYLSRDVAQE